MSGERSLKFEASTMQMSVSGRKPLFPGWWDRREHAAARSLQGERIKTGMIQTRGSQEATVPFEKGGMVQHRVGPCARGGKSAERSEQRQVRAEIQELRDDRLDIRSSTLGSNFLRSAGIGSLLHYVLLVECLLSKTLSLSSADCFGLPWCHSATPH